MIGLLIFAYVAIGFISGQRELSLMETHLRHKYPRAEPTPHPFDDAAFVLLLWTPTWPFQIALGALLDRRVYGWCPTCQRWIDV